MKHLKVYEQNAEFDPFGEDIEVEYDIVVEKPGFLAKHIKNGSLTSWKEFNVNYDEFFLYIKKVNPNRNLRDNLKMYYCGYMKGLILSKAFYENKYGK